MTFESEGGLIWRGSGRNVGKLQRQLKAFTLLHAILDGGGKGREKD